MPGVRRHRCQGAPKVMIDRVTYFLITCDECGLTGSDIGTTTQREMRREYRRHGWTYSQKTDRDLCYGCS